jgi:beta-fructofuranosidase
VLLFGCLHNELSAGRRARGERGGVWSVAIDSLTGPFDVSRATRLTDESLYCGKLVQDRGGSWWLMAFHNYDRGGNFLGGGLADPLPVAWDDDGNLRVADGRFDRLSATD